jgi:ketosteroid isomerase-like protein
MTDDLGEFAKFMKRRECAARAYVRGEPGPLEELVARSCTATFFGPHGNAVVGAAEVATDYVRGAGMFEAGGDSHFEILDMAASEGVAYWVGYQHARVRLRDKGEVAMKLRVTEVFRRENGAWVLVHRHADQAAADVPASAARAGAHGT